MRDPATGGEFVALIGIVVIFGLPLIYLMVNRTYAHRERMEMIARGMAPPAGSRWAKRMAGSAYVDPNAYAAPQFDPNYYPDRMLRKGINLTMIGFALLIGLSFIRLGVPGPWLLGGLIPMFIGIAQVITALASGARFGAWGAVPGSPYNNADQSSPQFGPHEVSPGPYGWRPGPTTPLERPVQPPDVK